MDIVIMGMGLLIAAAVITGGLYLIWLVIRALRKYVGQ